MNNNLQPFNIKFHNNKCGMMELKIVTSLSEKEIDAAMTNWVERTDNFTGEDFCGYVMSKGSDIICVPEELHIALMKYSK